jgi:hypothetical protein
VCGGGGAERRRVGWSPVPEKEAGCRSEASAPTVGGSRVGFALTQILLDLTHILVGDVKIWVII